MGDTVTYGRCKWCGLICDCDHPLKTDEEFNKRLEQEIWMLGNRKKHHSEQLQYHQAQLAENEKHLAYWQEYKEKNNS